MKKLLYIILSCFAFYAEGSEFAEIGKEFKPTQPTTEISDNLNEEMAMIKKDEVLSVPKIHLTSTIFRKLTNPQFIEKGNSVLVCVQDYAKAADGSVTAISETYKCELPITKKKLLYFEHHFPYLEGRYSDFEGYSSEKCKLQVLTKGIENVDTNEFIVTTGIFKHKLRKTEQNWYTISINLDDCEMIIGNLYRWIDPRIQNTYELKRLKYMENTRYMFSTGGLEVYVNVPYTMNALIIIP